MIRNDQKQGNYGLYMSVWDRLLGSNLPDNEARSMELAKMGTEKARGEPRPDAV